MSKVGFIGLGIMGRPMATNLVKAGLDVMVSDLNGDIVRELCAMGASTGTYAEIATACDRIVTILPTGAIVREVLFGENGISAALTAGKVVCDMSSVTPGESQECYRRLKALGVGFVDAPVSGGEPGAIAGTLAIMCGGDEADFARMKPVFDVLGSSALLIGTSGAGSVTKLANQIIVNLNIAAVSEALVLASKAGVDPMRVYHAIRGGLAGSTVLDAKAPMMCRRDFTPGGTVRVNHKDIKNVLATAHEIDVPLPLTAQLFEIQQALKVGGHMDDDHAGYVQYFEQLAGVTVRSDER
ncbi:2-hydroxy-3-oxopropionate reductase [Oscillibacter sp.]|uniref:2-hydroxy-3-oxopropionate reductase n=1 Tax=Oscillibacter sp. TaxID=1945593 RepID=UPI00260E5D65|nr:2-hydroxy-3-oxopropionate reductase [Oscillibacter sp.]MDD3346141.1 2-hydroxy-3-oxopropionate reductase [Oscillibacter sp.]